VLQISGGHLWPCDGRETQKLIELIKNKDRRAVAHPNRLAVRICQPFWSSMLTCSRRTMPSQQMVARSGAMPWVLDGHKAAYDPCNTTCTCQCGSQWRPSTTASVHAAQQRDQSRSV
jgi:hypothetical protein